MTAAHSLVVALVAAQLLACSSNCVENSVAAPAVFVSGTGTMDVTCADGTRRPAMVASRMLYSDHDEGRALSLSLSYHPEGVTPNTNLSISFPSELADGSYPMGGDNPRITVGASNVVEAITRGTFSFQRTRDMPFADIEDPERGDFASSIEFTLEMEGTLVNPGRQCTGPAPFTLAPVTIQLNTVTTVAECPSSFWGD